jgi:hypothetical protein
MAMQYVVPGQAVKARFTPFDFTVLASVLGMPANNVYFVQSTHARASNTPAAGTREQPFASMHYADTRCTASKGDVVIVLPGHVETVNAAAALDLNTAGVTWVGMGAGASRPTINFTTVVGADMNIDGAGITMMNFLFTGGIDALTGPIDVNAPDFTLLHWEWRDVTGQATDVVVADANADRLHLAHFFFNGAAAAGANSAIALIGMDNPHIHDFRMIGNFAVSAIDCRTTAVVDLDIHDGYIWTKNAADICIKDTITGSTGKCGPNLNLMLTDNASNVTEACTAATLQYFQPINIVNLAGESSLQTNITASTD